MRLILFFITLLVITSCSEPSGQNSLSGLLENGPFIEGKTEYLASPYVTAGNRVYMVGHQDGTFPDLGWHIKGEMGGIWNHPIKLMDGFEAEILEYNTLIKLDSAQQFTNYPWGNKHSYDLAKQQLQVERLQFVPDDMQGIHIEFAVTNTGKTERTLVFKFKGHSDLRPTWLGEETGMIDGQDEITFDENLDAFIAKDQNNPWYTVFGSDATSVMAKDMPSTIQGLGVSGSLSYKLVIPAGETVSLNMAIAGSYHSQAEAIGTYQEIKEAHLTFAKAKKERYATLATQTKLTVPDKDIEQAFEWLKYSSDWLIREVPELGTGIGAGIPDYPWWFGVDSEYALKGYMAIGQTEAVYETIRLLDSVSRALNGNGRIIHEMSTNGKVFNPGNINETPQFASLIWDIYRWNGDAAFLERYFPTIEQGLDWLMTAKDANRNGFPDGFGMMEIHGLDSEMIDVAVYTQAAFEDASKMAEVMGRITLSRKYKTIATRLKADINEQFWSEEFQSYADFIGTDAQALHLIEDAIVRADTLNKPWAVAELKATREQIKANPSDVSRPFVLHHNWVVNTPMEMGIADSAKAKKALKTAERFVNPFGVFVTGIDRDSSAGSDDGSFKASKQFSYTGAVMTLPTSVQVIAENNYGNPDQALNYIKRMNRSFSYAFPGSMYEVSPDYGMITQAWTIYGYAIPIVEQFFGIQPDGATKTIYINPQMPSSWNEASLENVKIGDTEISVFYSSKVDGSEDVRVTQAREGEWEIVMAGQKE